MKELIKKLWFYYNILLAACVFTFTFMGLFYFVNLYPHINYVFPTSLIAAYFFVKNVKIYLKIPS